MSADVWYVDSSALVKAVLAEHESPSLTTWIRSAQYLAASDIVRVEVGRAVRASDPAALPRAREVVRALLLRPIDARLCERAVAIGPSLLRSLDAIHLATALDLADDLAGLVTYDRRLAAAARSIGIRVESPGAVL